MIYTLAFVIVIYEFHFPSPLLFLFFFGGGRVEGLGLDSLTSKITTVETSSNLLKTS